MSYYHSSILCRHITRSIYHVQNHNLGQDPLFPDSADDVTPIVMNGISTGTSNHDFFSQVGNGYLLGEVEAMQDDDYNYGL